MHRSAITLVAVALIGSGCVSKSQYDAAVASANEARADEHSHVATLQDQLVRLQDQVRQLTEQLDAANAKLADQTAASKADIERLHREQTATEARAALFRDLAHKLAKMVDAGDLHITLRDGRMVLQLPNDILFDTAKTDIKPAGRKTLEQIATVLRTVQGHDFQIAGHTDNVPIETLQFPSNWELSCARALVVVHFLVAHGMDPTVLAAAGYGEFDPVASNDSDKGRAQNRRTEITLQPNIDELVAIPEAP